MKSQDHRNRHREYPQIRRHVGHIGKVRKGLLVDAFPLSLVPPRLDGPTSKAQHNLHDNDPGADKACGANDDNSEFTSDEDTVVQGQYGEFGEANGDVVKVAEDVVALRMAVSGSRLREMENEGGRDFIYLEKHLHIFFGNSLYMASESVRRSF